MGITSKICGSCHQELPAEAFNKNRKDGLQSYCKECQRRYKAEHREQVKAQQRAHRVANQEYLIAKSRIYLAEHREENKQRSKDYHKAHWVPGQNRWKFLRKRYGLTRTAYEAMFIAQDGKCAICYCALENDVRPSVDHDHATGEVRGILCKKCNTMIGLAGENPDVLSSAIAYLARGKEVSA